MENRSTPAEGCLCIDLSYERKDQILHERSIISKFDIENTSRDLLKEIMWEKVSKFIKQIESITPK